MKAIAAVRTKSTRRPPPVSGRVTSVAGTGTRGIGRNADGQAALSDGLRARPTHWPPLRLVRLCREHESVCVVLPAASPGQLPRGGYMRSIALDIHRDFCEVAIKE